jgi:hypothetical protein
MPEISRFGRLLTYLESLFNAFFIQPPETQQESKFDKKYFHGFTDVSYYSFGQDAYQFNFYSFKAENIIYFQSF